MGLSKKWISYGKNQEFSGYLAHMNNADKDVPAVIVIQEVWGVDEHIKNVTERFAQAGYLAFAPDLFSHNGERDEALKEDRIEEVKQFLDNLPPKAWGDPSERDKSLELYPQEKQERIKTTLGTVFGGLNVPEFVNQLKETTDFLRDKYTYGKGIGSVGFCLGGGLSATLASVDSELKGAIIFYGSSPNEEAIEQINCPVQGFYGEKDTRISSTVPELADKMNRYGKTFDYKIYEGAEHAFFNDTRRSYNLDAARDAFARSLQFFNKVLK